MRKLTYLRENDSDIRVFEVAKQEYHDDEGNWLDAGWYYWFVFPGCLPGSEPLGPFNSEQEALEDARRAPSDGSSFEW